MKKYVIGAALAGGIVGFILPSWLTIVLSVGGILWIIKTADPR